MKSTPLNSSFQCASFEPKKILPRFFRLREIQKNKKTQKNSYFWLPRQQMGSMTGTFPMPEFKSSYTITHRYFVRIGDKNFFRKNHVLPPSIEFAPRKKHLNGHSSLIKHNMAMKSTPLDSSFQCASFEPKKFYLAFFV
jgi:hypothetical protein